MTVSWGQTKDDPALEAVLGALQELAAPDPTERFGRAIRQSIDEVLDGPRTGRWSFDQLEKTEKTYVGTKIEIVIRTMLGLARGPSLDLEIAGHPVDIKWAMNCGWQIPQEAIGELCLCIGGLSKMSRFVVGLIRCDEAALNAGENRDRKRTISAAAKGTLLRFLVLPSPLPINFVAEMDPQLRSEVFAGKTIQARVTALFKRLPRVAIPRSAVATVAQTTGDPMRRLRADAWSDDPLEGMIILSSQYGNAVAEALGYPRLQRDEFMSIPRPELEALSREARGKLPPSAVARFGLG